jgi:hypothetical protein
MGNSLQDQDLKRAAEQVTFDNGEVIAELQTEDGEDIVRIYDAFLESWATMSVAHLIQILTDRGLETTARVAFDVIW